MNRNVGHSTFALTLLLAVMCIIPHLLNGQRKLVGKPIMRGRWRGEEIEYLDRQVVLKLRAHTSWQDVKLALKSHQVSVIQQFDDLGWGLIELGDTSSIFIAIDLLRSFASIEVAEPAGISRLQWEPNDLYYKDGHQWALKNNGQVPPGGISGADIKASKAWDLSKGSSNLRVAIVDGGVPLVNGVLVHPDLSNGNRIILGHNFTKEGNTVVDSAAHGTAVAGIVGAETDNGIGIAGIAPICKLVIIKSYDKSGVASALTLYNAVRWAVDSGAASIINYSAGLAYPFANDSAAVVYANQHNVFLVASAGNRYGPGIVYPAAFSPYLPNVIAVGGTDQNDNKGAYSSVGPQLCVVAPGGFGGAGPATSNIYTTTPTYALPGIAPSYDYEWATSFATPMVSGLAALILSLSPGLPPGTVRDIIEMSTDTVSGMGGLPFTNEYGYGRINAYKALKYTIEHYSTTLGDSGGTVVFHENFNTLAGTTLTIQPGTTIQLDPNVTLNINGRLLASGTSSQPITFNRTGTSGTWNGIALLSGSSATLGYCNFTNAYAALSCYTANANITNCAFTNSTIGVVCGALSPTINYCTFLNDYFGLYISGCNPTITCNDIENCANSGIYLTGSSPTIQYNTLKNNSQSGIWFHGGSSPSNVSHNNISGSSEGFYCDYGSSPHALYGCNAVRASYAQIYANYNCLPDFGDGSNSGLNSFDGTPYSYVNANNGSTVTSQYDWWGTTSPNPYQFTVDATSTIVWLPALSYDPNPGRPKVDAQSPSPTTGPFADSTLNLAYQTYISGENSEAISLFLKVFQANSTTPLVAKEALLFLADAYERSGKSDFLTFLTANIATRASLVPDLDLVQRELRARWLIKSGMYSDAIELYKGITTDFATNAEASKYALFSIGEIYSSYLNDHANATSAFQSFLTNYPKDRLAAVASFLMSSSTSAFAPSQQKSGGTIGSKEPAPSGFALESNYPNPFNPSTQISYSLPEAGKVSLMIYDVLGREVANLADGYQQAGRYSVTWNSTQKSGIPVSSGVYFARLRVLNDLGGVTFTKTSKLLLTK